MILLALAENTIQLVPDGTLLLHIALIAVMVGVLNLTLFKPINQILEERESRTRGRLVQAKKMMAAVEEKLTQYEQKLREARTESYRMLEQERARALQDREARLKALRAEISSWVSDQKLEIDRQAEEARGVLENESRRLAIEISSRLLQRPLKDNTQVTT